jgi:hypothetical protein
MHMRVLACVKLVILTSLAAQILSGCATLTKEQCINAEWYSIGYEDGLDGRPRSRLGQHREACAEYGVAPEPAKYLSGYEKGLTAFCVPHNGYRAGMAGRSIRVTCPAALSRDFSAAYAYGKRIHAAARSCREQKKAVNSKTRELEELRSRARQVEQELIAGKEPNRGRLMARSRELARREMQLEREIARLEADDARPRHGRDDSRNPAQHTPPRTYVDNEPHMQDPQGGNEHRRRTEVTASGAWAQNIAGARLARDRENEQSGMARRNKPGAQAAGQTGEHGTVGAGGGRDRASGNRGGGQGGGNGRGHGAGPAGGNAGHANNSQRSEGLNGNGRGHNDGKQAPERGGKGVHGRGQSESAAAGHPPVAHSRGGDENSGKRQGRGNHTAQLKSKYKELAQVRQSMRQIDLQMQNRGAAKQARRRLLHESKSLSKQERHMLREIHALERRSDMQCGEVETLKRRSPYR